MGIPVQTRTAAAAHNSGREMQCYAALSLLVLAVLSALLAGCQAAGEIADDSLPDKRSAFRYGKRGADEGDEGEGLLIEPEDDKRAFRYGKRAAFRYGKRMDEEKRAFRYGKRDADYDYDYSNGSQEGKRKAFRYGKRSGLKRMAFRYGKRAVLDSLATRLAQQGSFTRASRSPTSPHVPFRFGAP